MDNKAENMPTMPVDMDPNGTKNDTDNESAEMDDYNQSVNTSENESAGNGSTVPPARFDSTWFFHMISCKVIFHHIPYNSRQFSMPHLSLA